MATRKKIKKEGKDLERSLKDLKAVADWFSKREEVDVEEGLKQARKGAKLIKECRSRLKEIENEFEEIEKELE